MVFPTSPGVYTTEIDTTTGVPAVSVSTGALVGTFNWGPILQITEITSTTQLSSIFGTPDANTANSFFTAWNFLQYSQDLEVVRALGSNTFNATSNGTGMLIMNTTDYFNNVYPSTLSNRFAARYAGALGNTLEVIVFANGTAWTANAGNTSDPLYNFANQFSFAPNTSPYVTKVTNGTVTGDELHVLVVDKLGQITGTANSILERWPSLSRLSNCIGPTGISNYYKEYLYQNSQWIYNLGIPNANANGWDVTIQTANGVNLAAASDANANISSLSGGFDGTIVSGNTTAAQNIFSDPVTTDISLFMVGGGGQIETNGAIALAINRKDIVVFASPPFANVTAPSGIPASIINYTTGLTRSTYAFIDSGWKYQYDPYNNVYRWNPLNGDVAGLCARTDNTNDPWWSPAGFRRGQLLNVINLAYNPGLVDRNSLYQQAINPVVTFPGQGTVLYGDKTFINYASVFSRINVRRLFIVLEKTLSQAAQAELFEFNDAFTQATFVNLVTPFLRQVQGRRGISSFRVVCDDTNNTPAVINANQFVGDIYIIPNQSINYILLNFIAVDNGVNFNYIVGSVGA